jgi:hypothetical protein
VAAEPDGNVGGGADLLAWLATFGGSHIVDDPGTNVGVPSGTRDPHTTDTAATDSRRPVPDTVIDATEQTSEATGRGVCT